MLSCLFWFCKPSIIIVYLLDVKGIFSKKSIFFAFFIGNSINWCILVYIEQKGRRAMVRIDETLREALKQAVESAGSQSAFARLTGLGKQHISKYLRGDIKRMEHDTWIRLRPFIREFMPMEILTAEEEHKSWIKNNRQVSLIPVITLKQASGFDPTLESFDDYAFSLEHGNAPMLEDRDGMLAVRITSEDRDIPWYLPGTVIYIDCKSYPSQGKRVIVKLKKDIAPLFRIFFREESRVMLFSTDGKGDLFWDTPEENPCSWIYPIRYSFREEDPEDSELHKMESRWKEKLSQL